MGNTTEGAKTGAKIYVSREKINICGCVSCETKTLQKWRKTPQNTSFWALFAQFSHPKILWKIIFRFSSIKKVISENNPFPHWKLTLFCFANNIIKSIMVSHFFIKLRTGCFLVFYKPFSMLFKVDLPCFLVFLPLTSCWLSCFYAIKLTTFWLFFLKKT